MARAQATTKGRTVGTLGACITSTLSAGSGTSLTTAA